MTLENRLRGLAFGDPGELRITPDHRFAGVAARARTDRERWLVAVVLGAHGRYAAATTLLRRLRHSSDVVIASLAASTLASHRRQLGGHAAALPADGAALAAVAGLPLTGAADGDGIADGNGIDVAGAWADALLGVAADQLALGRPATARSLVAEVTAGLDGAFGAGGGSLRSRVRAGWVGAEAALASGDVAAAVASAEEALHRVETAPGASPVRHRAKTELVLAAALSASGALDGTAAASTRPAELVTSALATIEAHGFASLSWPARLLAADADPAHADEHRRRATREVHTLLRRVDPELRRLAVESPWVPV